MSSVSYVAYEGKSGLIGQKGRVVAVMTVGRTMNTKVGDMAQLWIIPSGDTSPAQAVSEKEPARSVCGDCKHLTNGTCYVNVAFAPQAVYRAYKAGSYSPSGNSPQKPVRLGAYGDPAALPIGVVRKAIANAPKWTGYSHQWSKAKHQSLKAYVMASCDSAEERAQAKAMGWRTFRVKNASDPVLPGEVVCPASEEAGKKTTCAKCGLCCGTAIKAKDVVINVHGGGGKIPAFGRMSLSVV